MGAAIQQINVLCRPSVYLLYDAQTLVYVGQSKTPQRRVLQHRGDKTFTAFKILRCLPDRRKYWEDVLIRRFRPKYNKQVSNGSRKPAKNVKSLTSNAIWHQCFASGLGGWVSTNSIGLTAKRLGPLIHSDSTQPGFIVSNLGAQSSLIFHSDPNNGLGYASRRLERDKNTLTIEKETDCAIDTV